MPNSSQLRPSWATWKAACESRMGRPRSWVGVRVVGGGDGPLGVTHGQAAAAESLERLRAGDLMDQVQVDAQDGRRTRLVGDNVLVPDLLDERPWA